MDYARMIKEAKANGKTNESKMWQSVSAISEMMESMKKKHPDEYWKMIRKQYGILYDNHYGPDFADYDVSQMYYTNAKGERREGAHWSKQQIVDATRELTFPEGVTDDDKYVAYNATYADLCADIDDATILKVAYRFWFHDDDWSEKGSATKIWEYMDR